MGSWGNRTTSDLVGFLEGAMPPGNPGSLGEEAYVNVVAFLLDYNGARPGNQPLTAATKTEIRSVATGQVRAVAQAGGRGGRRGAAAGPGGAAGRASGSPDSGNAPRAHGFRRSQELIRP